MIGASERPGSRGAAALANLLGGGFAGPIRLVNPRHATAMGRPCLARVADLPEAPDLAVVVTPPELAPQAVADVAARGGRVAVVLSAGMGAEARQRMLDAARPHLLRVIGPDALGVMIPKLGLNASLGHLAPPPGRIGLISASGAIASVLVDEAAERGVGFSHVAALGAMADVDVGDYLDLLAMDGRTRAIVMYLEAIPAARKFLSAARAAARLKPVIVLRAGRAGPASATPDDLGAGADAVADAALRRAGVLGVDGLDALFAAAETVARFRPLARARVAIVTNGGGAGLIAADGLAGRGADLAALAPATLAAIAPGGAARSNPLDIGADAGPAAYVAALKAAAGDPGVDAVLAMHCPSPLADGAEVAAAVAAACVEGRVADKPLLACWLGGAGARAARRTLRDGGVASYDDPGAAAAAIGHLAAWGRAQAALLRVPDRALEEALEGAPQDARAGAEAVFRAAAAAGRSRLTAPEALAALAAYGVPVAETRLARDPRAAGAVAREMLAAGGALAVKLVAAGVGRKSDVGGVVLDLETPETVEAAACAIARRLGRAAAPGATGVAIEGFAVQRMVRRSLALELVLGVSVDAAFGPAILFGAGGTAAEVIGDTAVALPPLDAALAADLVGRTRVGRLLAGYRERPAADAGALNGALVALSRMVEDFPALRAVEVNPLLADARGVIALDARIAFEPAELDCSPPNPGLAIRPYPGTWKREVGLTDGRYAIRPILPLDVLLYPAFLAKVDAEDVRMRFLAPRRRFSDEMVVRLTQLDYDREMAFVALAPSGEMAGVSRLAADPDHVTAEYAILVRSDLAGRGLGTALMKTLIDYARADGIERLEGMILAENRAMRTLMARLGFRDAPMADEPGVVMSRLELR